MNEPPIEIDQLQGIENRVFAAHVLAAGATEYREAAHAAARRTHEMPRPTIAGGFPPGYREAMREYRRCKAAERALVTTAEELGIEAEFGPLYNDVLARTPVPTIRRPPETAPRKP